jgi:hypothetical protein
MLPKFTLKYYEGPARFFVETDWFHRQDGLEYCLQVTTSGRLDTASAGWKTKAKAEAALEQCKARLR